MLALISIVYGALVAIGQDDMLRLIGLTSLSHFGFIMLGIFVFSSNGVSGAILYMVNHGIATAALFLVAGFLIRRTRHRPDQPDRRRREGHARCWPARSWSPAWRRAACPGLSPFVSEILVLISAFDYAWWAARSR